MARSLVGFLRIEIDGEPPMERKMFGRVSRQSGVTPMQLRGFGPVEMWGKT